MAVMAVHSGCIAAILRTLHRQNEAQLQTLGHAPFISLFSSPLRSLIFVLGGFNKIPAFAALSGHVAAAYASLGLVLPPVAAEVLLGVAVFLELGGGLLLITGFERMGATLILLFLMYVRFGVSRDASFAWRQVTFDLSSAINSRTAAASPP